MCSPSRTKGRAMRSVLQKKRIGHGVLQLKTTREMESGDFVVTVRTSYTLCAGSEPMHGVGHYQAGHKTSDAIQWK